MTKEHVTIRIDTREAIDSELVRTVKEHEEVEDVIPEKMEAGDLRCGAIGFERKRWNDFINSMKKGRLEEQADKMLQAYERPHVIIQGDMRDTEDFYYSGINPRSARGEIAKLEEVGISVMLCSNLPLLVDYVVRRSRKYVEEAEIHYLNTGPVDVSEPSAKRMYGCLPKIGEKYAPILYEKYPLPIQLALAEPEDLMSLDGIGEKRANDIIRTMRGEV